MSGTMRKETIEPETLEHIAHQTSARGSQARCGCGPTSANKNRWWLCDFHEGYDEGVAVMRQRLAAAEQETPLQQASREVTEQQDQRQP